MLPSTTNPGGETTAPSNSSPPNAIRKEDYQIIYPQYIDAMLTPKQGRRLTKTQAVATPTIQEMFMALQALGYKKFLHESGKSYPRSQSDMYFSLVPQDRIRVPIKQPADVHYIKKSEFDHELRESTVQDIPNKMELLRRIAAYIKETNPERPKQPTADKILADCPKIIKPIAKTKTKRVRM